MTLPSDTYFRNGVNISIFIDTMQRNFILTDVMKTGNNSDFAKFISMNTMQGQTFDTTDEYYTLHNYDLDSYDRRFAVIDVRTDNVRFSINEDFNLELRKRCELLQSQGFVFIKATPWESIHNIENTKEFNPVIGADDSIYFPKFEIPHVKWSAGTSWFWFYMYVKHKDNNLKFMHDEKKYDFLYLNKTTRAHRKKMLEQMQPLLDNSLWTDWSVGKKLPSEYELPWAQDYPKTGMDQDIYEKPYNDTKYSLISETNDTNDEIFITEKLWKAIMAKHVFVVHGNHLYLQKLREMGFKTFGSHLDEAYDLVADKDKRINSIVNTCQSLLGKNWHDIYLQTQALRQHNYDTLFNKEKLGEQINRTLELFLEFADRSQVPS